MKSTIGKLSIVWGLGLFLASGLGVAPVPAAGANDGKVILRAGPGAEHAAVGTLTVGDTVLSQVCMARAWCMVRTTTTKGWVPSRFLERVRDEASNPVFWEDMNPAYGRGEGGEGPVVSFAAPAPAKEDPPAASAVSGEEPAPEDGPAPSDGSGGGQGGGLGDGNGYVPGGNAGNAGGIGNSASKGLIVELLKKVFTQ